jgi:hypothetical protein
MRDRRFRNNPAQRRAIIEATIGHLQPFPRGYARTQEGPFFSLRTIGILLELGALRVVRLPRGRRTMHLSARSE